jgi:hypothetical protein
MRALVLMVLAKNDGRRPNGAKYFRARPIAEVVVLRKWLGGNACFWI